MSKLDFFVFLESEAEHCQPGTLSGGYRDLLFTGLPYMSLQVSQLTPTHQAGFLTSHCSTQPVLFYKGSHQFQKPNSN